VADHEELLVSSPHHGTPFPRVASSCTGRG
jgi:hypothetical protein